MLFRSELDALAAATGGSVQPLSSSGADIADAILAGLGNLPVDVTMASNCDDPIGVSFAPAAQTVTSGDDALFIDESGAITILDWKRTQRIRFDGFRSLREPIDHLPDANGWLYCLQLNTYKCPAVAPVVALPD